ncbi:MAG: tetratricopeptide repeat protein [Spartobacteria bacterium]
MNFQSFFTELKRRNVYKVAVGYGVVAWLVMQVAATIVPALHLPESLTTAVVVVTLLGFPLALVIAWAFEMTPDGMKRTENVSPNDHIPQWSRRKFVAFVVTVGLIAAALLGWQLLRPKDVPSSSASAKSIAVLPFENLSADKNNAFFADGIQDEILTRLAKIGDLKVISRTSTQRYKSSPDDLPKIARQLGVAHILEGSVQKSGDKVRVTVQLIAATTDSHLWAETYDRSLTDIFAVESEVAEKIAGSLRARLTGAEQAAVSAKSTENTEAYEAYLHGLALWNRIQTSPKDLENTVMYFSRAVQLDPNFALAWASLSVAQTFTYAEFDRTPQRLAQSKQALDTALQLAPKAGETQFALGVYRYRGLSDYEEALAAFAKARREAASRVEALEFSAYVKRRQGKWDEALALHAQSLELDPRNPILLSEAAQTYRALRRFDEALRLLDRALEIEPNSFNLLILKAEIYRAQGDTETATRLLARVPTDGQDPIFLNARLRLWLFLRQYDQAIQVLRPLLAAPENLPQSFVSDYRASLGIAEALAGQREAATSDLSRAREELLALRAQGDKRTEIATDLILIAGFLGDKAALEREAALAQPTIEQEAMDGPGLEWALAVARTQMGEKDIAIANVKHLLAINGWSPLTPALLRLDPFWDPLRSDPRFENLSRP